eukprot:CAMPEP_0194387480 /NCGR_PEP_ID=MMETSP0174-20130528/92547_1 /TAXON_ID=216777 /ORGANISM="Proboscia alata, Strain PI-D3" /LENGTH=94 /DNA_ID=CAMNT_0039177701 /DNA_START=38 /DNA_END=319 /DNA_ORIENTATION=-
MNLKDMIPVSSTNQDNQKQIPLVKLALEHITYRPVTRSYPNVNVTADDGSIGSNSIKRSVSRVTARKTILNNVTPPPIEPFQLQGWMGPSGSGK